MRSKNRFEPPCGGSFDPNSSKCANCEWGSWTRCRENAGYGEEYDYPMQYRAYRGWGEFER